MAIHFGVITRDKADGMKLTRENYVKVNNKSSLRRGYIYTDLEIEKQTEDSLYNFDININYFQTLSKETFNKTLQNVLLTTEFFEIDNLTKVNEVPGYYIMILDEYKQAYVGTSDNIKKRIQTHWSSQKQFDRLIFGTKEKSILSIDSFRALDTTRIFVYPNYKRDTLNAEEDNFINLFEPKYLLNRTKGGSLLGLQEAIIHRKNRE